jgi:DNA-binding PadR family transcriptional regulator
VIEHPSHGYELAQRFKRVYGETLVLTSRLYIYPLLETLSNHGFIEEIPVGASEQAPTSRPKPHYRVTEQGKDAYQEWLVSQFNEERHRSWLFARQLGMLEPEVALEVIKRYEQEYLNEAEAETTETTVAPEDGSDLAERLANEDHRLAVGVRLSWLEYARSELKALVEERARRR